MTTMMIEDDEGWLVQEDFATPAIFTLYTTHKTHVDHDDDGDDDEDGNNDLDMDGNDEEEEGYSTALLIKGSWSL